MIDNLVIEGTNKTPKVILTAATGVLEIAGKSIPENSFGFYQPLMVWLDNYALQPLPKTEVNMLLEYFNTSSSKCILDFLRKLEVLHKSGKTHVQILWHYEEEDEDNDTKTETHKEKKTEQKSSSPTQEQSQQRTISK